MLLIIQKMCIWGTCIYLLYQATFIDLFITKISPSYCKKEKTRLTTVLFNESPQNEQVHITTTQVKKWNIN